MVYVKAGVDDLHNRIIRGGAAGVVATAYTLFPTIPLATASIGSTPFALDPLLAPLLAYSTPCSLYHLLAPLRTASHRFAPLRTAPTARRSSDGTLTRWTLTEASMKAPRRRSRAAW